MKYSKVKNELPEYVRTRVVEAKKKLKKLHGRLFNSDNIGDYSSEGTIKSTVALLFLEFPQLELTILRDGT
jgi:hypothetical protein